MKITLSIIFSLFIINSFSLFSNDLPRWTEYEYRSKLFPLSRYYTGFSSEIFNKNDNFDEFKKRIEYYAKQLLAESIKTSIESSSIIEIANINTETDESYKKISSFKTNIDLSNIVLESHYDTKDKVFYAFAYVKRQDIIDNNLNLIENLLIKTQSILNNITVTDWETDPKMFRANINLCRTNLSKIEESQSLLTWLGINDMVQLKSIETNDLRNGIKQKQNAIKSKEHKTLNSLCNEIAIAFAETGVKDFNQISISNLTFQNTNLPSEFSDVLNQELVQSFSQYSNCKILNSQHFDDSLLNQMLNLSGNFWIENDKIKVNTNIREAGNGAILFSQSESISKAEIDLMNYEVRPPELVQKLEMLKKFSEDEVVGSNLYIELWTNKGNENLIFKHHDVLKISIRTNKECYLRFIYHLADGNRVLLLDNYYIPTKNVNKIIELPYEFECIEPFGVEVLQLNAQSKQFTELRTQEAGPYKIILNDLDETLSTTRGFAINTNTDLKAEKRLILTTIE